MSDIVLRLAHVVLRYEFKIQYMIVWTMEIWHPNNFILSPIHSAEYTQIARGDFFAYIHNLKLREPASSFTSSYVLYVVLHMFFFFIRKEYRRRFVLGKRRCENNCISSVVCMQTTKQQQTIQHKHIHTFSMDIYNVWQRVPNVRQRKTEFRYV